MRRYEMSDAKVSFKDEIEQISKWAKFLLLKDGCHTPIMTLIGEKSSAIVGIPAMPESSEERQQLMRYVGTMAATSKSAELGSLRWVFFIHEGWADRKSV